MTDTPVAPQPSNEQPNSATRKRTSWPFFVLSGALAVVAILLYTGVINLNPPPKAPPGANQVIDVVQALDRAGIASTMDPKVFAPAGAFPVPGQGLMVGDTAVLVFIFESPAEAEQAMQAVDPSKVIPAKYLPSGAQPVVLRGSNVVIALPDSDAGMVAAVTMALDGLE